MATVVNQNTKMISITRGDTAFIGIKPKYRDTKEPYQFEAGDVVMFRFVKGNVYFEKRCEIDTVQNKCILNLTPEDTLGLPFDVYTYEIELIPMTGGRFTFIAQKMFNITFEVEKHIMTAITETSYVPASNQATANNTLLTAELHAMDVLDGDIDRTNGSVVEVVRRTTAEWVMFEDNVSKDGEIYVYTDYRTVEGVDLSATKIGDGVTTIGDLPFATLPITEDDIQTWNAAVQDADYVHTDNNYDDEAKAKVDTLGSAAFYDAPESGNAGTDEVVLGDDTRLSDARVASDVYPWAKAETKPTYNYSEIKDTPTLGTAAAKNVPATGDATAGEVVLGSDTRLTDARNAKDVYAWAKAAAKPTYSYSEIQNTPTLGTAAAKDFTTSVLEGSGDLVTSGAVKSAIDNAVSSVYKPSGNKACAELISSLLVAANLGNVYNITDNGTTTSDFVEGAGKAIEAGDNVVIVDIGSSVYKFDLLSGMVDLSNYVQKSSTSGLIKNDGTIDQTAYAKQNEMSVSTSGDQTTIQLKNGTSATVINAHQDISGKANKSEMTVTPGTGSDADKTTIQLKSGTDATVLTQHQDISGKVDKEQGKGLSTNDYTTAEKEKLAAISTEANKVTASETNGNIQIDGTEATVYDDTELQGAVSDLEDDVEEIQGEISTDTANIEGNPLNFSTLSAQNAESTIIDLEPIQDLHGYDKPWVGGAGKNKLDVSTFETPSTFTKNNEVFTNNIVDSRDYLNLVGTAGSTAVFTRQSAPTGLFVSDAFTIASDVNRFTVKHSGGIQDLIIIFNQTIPSGSYKFVCTITNNNPSVVGGLVISNCMLILSTETDSSFAPYTNICPITGRTQVGIGGCGKNLIRYPYPMQGSSIAKSGTTSGITWHILDDNSVFLEGNKTATANVRLNVYSTISSPISPKQDFIPYIGKEVILSGGISGGSTNTYFLNFQGFVQDGIGIQNYGTDQNIVISDITDFNTIQIVVAVQSGYTIPSDGLLFKPMIRLASNTDNTFEPYNKNTDLTISLGQTVYGGTLDVENGVLVAFPRFLDLGDLTWEVRESVTARANLPANAKFISQGTKVNAISSRYEICPQSEITQHNACITFNSAVQIYIRDTTASFTTPESVQQYLSGAELCYELATPITINLTPNVITLLEGVNNISTTADGIKLTYRDGSVATLGDLKSAVDDLQDEIDNPIAYDGKTYRLGMDATGLYLYNITDDTKAYIQMVSE